MSNISFGDDVCGELIIPKKGGHCSFFYRLSKIKVLNRKIR